MRLYNTLSGQKEALTSSDGKVNMYVCGVTPYAQCHIGHAMCYVIFDVLRRYLEFRGFQVRHVQNFTDIDDKLINGASHLGIPVEELAERYIDEYFQNMDALNIMRAHIYPRATQEIPEILKIIGSLVEKGYAYPSDGDVYYRVQKAPGYGKLGHRSLEGMMAGARVEVSAAKEHPMDFALWKGSKPGEPSWDSPWGKGRPGWHIECSAMTLEYIGATVDIHGGGQDLIFPHHENEIAQSEAYTGIVPFVKIWVHNGLLRMGEDKMSKSLGNLVTVHEALERYTPDALRLFFLSSHYRSPLTYSEEAIEAQERAAERLRIAVREATPKGDDALDSTPYRDRFLNAMDDDLNTPQALASLFDLARDINRGKEEGRSVKEAAHKREAAPFIELLVETREALRTAKRYDLADLIRDRLAELGVALEDTPGGTLWKLARP